MDIYLDNNATTQPSPEVVATMLAHLDGRFGNAASSHVRGRAARAAVEDARSLVGAVLGVGPTRVVFTSGATESLNAALQGLAEDRPAGRSRLVVSATEHKAVLDTADWLAERRGVEVAVAPVLSSGAIDLDALAELLTPETFAVAVMLANNETGVLNPVGRIRELVRSVGADLVCDATQGLGKVQLDFRETDFVTVSSHKVYGPQGVGSLVMPRLKTSGFTALIHGGGHERGYRSGTLNLPGIVGFGKAAELVTTGLSVHAAHMAACRDRLESGLLQLGGVHLNGGDSPRLPNTTNLRIRGVDADALIATTPEVAFASGSACTSAVPTPSHVLTAMGLSTEAAEQSIRLSVGRYTTEEEIDRAIELISASVERIRDLEGYSG
jgi:cysteine desulfurase